MAKAKSRGTTRVRIRQERAAGRTHADYTGGIYGSLLAASVVVGAGTLGPLPRLELAVLLLATGLVFWIAHVHAQLFGARLVRQSLDRHAVMAVCREEWPIVNAAVPPVIAVGVGWLLGLDLAGTLWLTLAVAVAGQVGWSVAAAREARASWSLAASAGVVNLVIGLLIVALKAGLTH
ncbi:hypothetical protein ACFV5G_39115 [Streptomyces sp. NPDC059766]|uniref:hypothetical protein n=1 Tax=Streptomyces sp. NPDC059766 TaxID=3346940 RepID=UPI003655AB70